MIDPDKIGRIVLHPAAWREIVDHCERKLEGHFLEGESREHKAYGLVTGTQAGDILLAEGVFPAKTNLRSKEPFKTYLDQTIDKYPEPSKIPVSERGWVMDPEEIKGLYDRCEREGLEVIGIYHMHRTPRDEDPLRDTPTRLDRALARNCGLFAFIVSMIDRDHPRIRAFFEARVDREVPIQLAD